MLLSQIAQRPQHEAEEQLFRRRQQQTAQQARAATQHCTPAADCSPEGGEGSLGGRHSLLTAPRSFHAGARAGLQELKWGTDPKGASCRANVGEEEHQTPQSAPKSHPALPQGNNTGTNSPAPARMLPRNHLDSIGKHSARATNCDKLLTLECKISSQGFTSPWSWRREC